jgi:tripartite-type tricarboxylate transporter receptor subunit TctC
VTVFRLWFYLLAAMLGGSSLFATDARAQTYPSRPIRWIVGYPPGGTTDIIARVIGQYLTEHLGQQVIIDNRPGAGNNIGTELVLKSAPDGYTVLLVNPANAINSTLYKKLNFDFLADWAPIAGIVRVPNVMEINPAVPAKTVAEFIAYAKANPNKINMASSGSGTSVHLSGELFRSMTGIEMIHIPYKGAAPALTDLIAGQVQVMFDNLPSSIAHIKSGELRALGVTTLKPNAALPDVPAIADTVPGYEASAWFGMAGPKGLPTAIVDKLNKTINEALADPTTKTRLADLGGDPIPDTPAAFGALHAAETAKWAKVVTDSGAHVD